MATWSDNVLCTQQDLEDEVGDLSALVLASDTDLPSVVSKAIAGTKKDLERRMKGELESIFLVSLQYYPSFTLDYSGWVDAVGLDWDQIDSLLDYLANPTELNACAVAGTLYRLYNRLCSSIAAKYGEADTAMQKERDNWKDIFETRYNESIRNLWFDLNADGKIQKTETTRARQGIRIA